MDMKLDLHIRVGDPSAVGEVRRRASEIARSVGFDDERVGRLAIVTNELCTNLLKHAGGGDLLVHALESGTRRGIAVLALDRGPGFADFSASLRDGTSTTGTSGRGLGAVARLSKLESFSEPGKGAAILARIWDDGAAPADVGMVIGAVNVAHPQSDVSGDAWETCEHGKRTMLVVADGLGHGMLAAEAAWAAMAVFREHSRAAPAEILQRIHEGLRSTRGAAVAVFEVDRGRGTVSVAGLGNIAGTLINGVTRRSIVSHHGTAGHNARRFEEFHYPWSADTVLVAHSDGLSSQWDLAAYPGLAAKHPQLAAGVLFRDFSRGRDDTTVIVLREVWT
jgi:anti-sigma regulatory factor (Ser/Thr protein kinase)